RIPIWWVKHSIHEVWTSMRDPDWLPVRTALAEARGVVVGPVALVRSKLSRRRVPPITLPEVDPRSTPVPIVVGAEAPSLSLVIPSRNRRKQLGDLLAALGRQTYPPERFETIVALDGSEDDSGEMVRHLDVPYRIQLLEHDQVGAATTRNRGTRTASSSHVVFVDDDVVPDADFLSVHALAHRHAPDEHLALRPCPPVVKGEGLWGQSLRIWWEDHYRAKTDHGHRWTFTDFDGGNASFPKRVFLDAGGFDEEFPGRGREDWELGTRLLDRGVRFAYYPEAIAWHHLDTRLETNLRH